MSRDDERAGVPAARPLRCRPTATQELLVAACLGPDPAAWRSWCARVEIDHIDEESFRHLPLAWYRLRALGPSDRALELAGGVFRRAWYQNHLLLRELEGVLDLLAGQAFDVLLLKGASIALRYYPDPATRPIGDLDVLVRHRDAPRAAAALAAAGWTPAKRTPVEELQGYAHGVSFRRGAASLDLHWNALWAKRSADADGPLWDAAESIDFRGRKAWALSPSDELAHVCLHGARRSQNAYSWQPNPLVRWVTDAAWILRAREIDWQRVAATVARYHARLQALDALSYLSTGPLLPVPVELLEAWAAVRSPADRLHYDLALTPRPPALFPLLPRFRFWSSYRMKLYHERGANGVDDMGFAARAAGFPSYLNAFLKGDLDAGRLRALPSRLARKLLRRPSLLRLGPERLANVSRRRPAGGR